VSDKGYIPYVQIDKPREALPAIEQHAASQVEGPGWAERQGRRLRIPFCADLRRVQLPRRIKLSGALQQFYGRPPFEPEMNLRGQLQRDVMRQLGYVSGTWVTLYSQDIGDTRFGPSALPTLIGTFLMMSSIVLVLNS